MKVEWYGARVKGLRCVSIIRVADARLWRAVEEVAEKEELAANSSAGPWICISDVVANAPLPLLKHWRKEKRIKQCFLQILTRMVNA